LHNALEDAANGLSFTLRSAIKFLYEDLQELSKRIGTIDNEIKSLCKVQPRYDALL